MFYLAEVNPPNQSTSSGDMTKGCDMFYLAEVNPPNQSTSSGDMAKGRDMFYLLEVNPPNQSTSSGDMAKGRDMFYLPEVNQPNQSMTKAMLKQWHQAKDYQCPKCHPVPNSQILCCKRGKVFRLSTTLPSLSLLPQFSPTLPYACSTTAA